MGKRLFRITASALIGKEFINVFVGRVELSSKTVCDFYFSLPKGKHGSAEYGWQPGLAEHHSVFTADGRFE